MSGSFILRALALSLMPKQPDVAELMKDLTRSLFFTILAACMTVLLIGIGLYMLHLSLMQAGLASLPSLAIIAGFLTLGLAICLLLVRSAMNQLQEACLCAPDMSSLGKLDDVIDAFMDGWVSRQTSEAEAADKSYAPSDVSASDKILPIQTKES